MLTERTPNPAPLRLLTFTPRRTAHVDFIRDIADRMLRILHDEAAR